MLLFSAISRSTSGLGTHTSLAKFDNRRVQIIRYPRLGMLLGLYAITANNQCTTQQFGDLLVSFDYLTC